MTSFDDLLSVDPLGFVCVPADMLDAAFARADKPSQVPRTCADGLAQPTPTTLAAQLGHEPTLGEWVSTWVHWKQATNASLSAPPPYQIETAITPLPGSALLLASALGAALAVARWRSR